MDWLKDTRTDSWSVLTTMPIGTYLDMVKLAHADRGGIVGQRDVLKTTTAKRIRARMIADIRQGAVLPPVVIGATVSSRTFETYPLKKGVPPDQILPKKEYATLSIIDGMQRTAALFEAAAEDKLVLAREVRVEFWIAKSVGALIYRMLVLNTGQVPWTLSRQLSVVYAPLLHEINENVKEIGRIFSPDQPGRRVAATQFQSDSLVELYLAFSLRKTTVDSREELSEEFSRLDFADNLSDDGFQDQFYETLNILARFDRVFEKYDSGDASRFSKGRNIFDGQPARVGFVVAVAQNVLGRPGLERKRAERKKRMTEIKRESDVLITKLEKMSSENVGKFLKLDVLTEVLDRRVGQVGRYERAMFFEAFKVLLEERFNLPDLEACWRA